MQLPNNLMMGWMILTELEEGGNWKRKEVTSIWSDGGQAAVARPSSPTQIIGREDPPLVGFYQKFNDGRLKLGQGGTQVTHSTCFHFWIHGTNITIDDHGLHLAFPFMSRTPWLERDTIHRICTKELNGLKNYVRRFTIVWKLFPKCPQGDDITLVIFTFRGLNTYSCPKC